MIMLLEGGDTSVQRSKRFENIREPVDDQCEQRGEGMVMIGQRTVRIETVDSSQNVRFRCWTYRIALKSETGVS